MVPPVPGFISPRCPITGCEASAEVLTPAYPVPTPDRPMEELHREITYPWLADQMEWFAKHIRVVHARVTAEPDAELEAYKAWMRTDLDPDYCACCTSGNHTEPCTCDGTDCCHPESHADNSAWWSGGTNTRKPKS